MRWGNWAVAKLIEALYNTSHLSDVGCTYRLLRAERREEIAATMTVGGNHAGAEIMLLAILSGAASSRSRSTIFPASGLSSVTGDPLKALVVGLRMIGWCCATGAPRPAAGARQPSTRLRPGRSASHEQLPL